MPGRYAPPGACSPSLQVVESPQLQHRFESLEISASNWTYLGNEWHRLKTTSRHEDDTRSTAASSSAHGVNDLSNNAGLGKRKRGDEPQRPRLYLDELSDGLSQQQELVLTEDAVFSAADAWKPALYLAVEECTVDLKRFLGQALLMGSTVGTASSLVAAACVGAAQSTGTAAGANTLGPALVASPTLVATSAIQDLAFTGEPVTTALLGFALAGCFALPSVAAKRQGLLDCPTFAPGFGNDAPVASDPADTRQVASGRRAYLDAGASVGTSLEVEDARNVAAMAVTSPVPAASSDAAGSWCSTREFYFLDNSMLADLTMGLGYRRSKCISDKADDAMLAPWGSIICGVDEGDGWVKVADFCWPKLAQFYLPKQVRNTSVLKKHEGADHFVWIVDNSKLRDCTDGLAYRRSKNRDDKVADGSIASWGSRIYGREDQDGWVRVGDLFLPCAVRGIAVLRRDATHIWPGVPAIITSDVHQLERSIRDAGMHLGPQWPSGPSAQAWLGKLGLVGNVTKVDPSGAVHLDGGLGWVPITALVGFAKRPPDALRPVIGAT